MIDLHCHILPGLDDGARDLGESLAMAGAAASDGIRVVCAVAHGDNGVFEVSMDRVREAVDELRARIRSEGIPLEVVPGQEVRLARHMARRVEEGLAGTLADRGRHLLLELPPDHVPPYFLTEVFDLAVSGITPVIAHPERNRAVQKDPSILYEAVRAGALAQLTGESLGGGWGRAAAKCSKILLKHSLIHVLASDAHSPEHRPPRLSKALTLAAKILGSREEARALVQKNPRNILDGNPVEAPLPEKP